MRKIIVTFGLISGAISSLMMIALVTFGGRIGFDRGAIIGNTSIVLDSERLSCLHGCEIGLAEFGYGCLPSHLPQLDLVPVLLQNDTYQLTARPDSSLGKKLLKGGFDGALGDPDPRRNFLVGKSLEYE